MKHITKQPEPQSFVNWKAAYPNATFKHDLMGQVKRELKQNLIREQHALCCYCECRIDEHNSHIEHFKPKSVSEYSHLQLDYDNLFASCTAEGADDHCGHKKDNRYSSDLISPLENDCSSHFTYTLDGKIQHTTGRGKETIKMLRLDSKLLEQQRKTLIDHFLDKEDYELSEVLAYHLDTTRAEYGEFYSMIEYLHSQKLL